MSFSLYSTSVLSTWRYPWYQLLRWSIDEILRYRLSTGEHETTLESSKCGFDLKARAAIRAVLVVIVSAIGEHDRQSLNIPLSTWWALP